MPDTEFDETPEQPGNATSRQARPLNLRQIEVFRTIMTTGSISGAGRVLHVSQPAVSRVLALTESRLGYPLFERSRGRLLPTPEAQRLYGEVEQVYSGIGRVNDLALALGQEGSGVLQVVAGATFAQWLVPQALMRMWPGYSQRSLREGRARVDYRSATFDEIVGYFQSGKADVALSMSAPRHPHLHSTLLGQQPVVCVMPRGHALANHAEIHASDFTASAWIGYPADAPLGRAMQPFLERAPGLPPAVEVHSAVTAMAFVMQGLGPAIVDCWCVPPELAPLVDIRPVVDAPMIQIWATHSNLAPLSLLGKRFLQHIEAVLKTTGTTAQMPV